MATDCDGFLLLICEAEISSSNIAYCNEAASVLCAADPAWMFPTSLAQTDTSIDDHSIYDSRLTRYSALVKRLRLTTRVPELTMGCENYAGEYEEKEVEQNRKCTLVVCNIFCSLLDGLTIVLKAAKSTTKLSQSDKSYDQHSNKNMGNLNDTSANHLFVNFCHRVLLAITREAVPLYAEHSIANQTWTSQESIAVAKRLIDVVCSANDCTGLKEYLRSEDGVELFKAFLVDVSPRLSKHYWKRNPSIVQSFSVLLQYIRWPTVGGCLERILPPTLLLIDDYDTRNRLLGLRCLAHVLDNASKAELRGLGRIDVIYDSLQKLLYQHDDVDLVDTLLPTLVTVLDVMEKQPGVRAYSRHDEIFRRILADMEMLNANRLRVVYAKHLPRLLASLGILSVRRAAVFVRVLDAYLQSGDDDTRIFMLEALLVFIKMAWPRISRHAKHLINYLVRLVYDISIASSQSGDCETRDHTRLIVLISECLKLLDTILIHNGTVEDNGREKVIPIPNVGRDDVSLPEQKLLHNTTRGAEENDQGAGLPQTKIFIPTDEILDSELKNNLNILVGKNLNEQFTKNLRHILNLL